MVNSSKKSIKPPLINEYIRKLNEALEKNSETEAFFYVYRGQPSKEWNLNCTAARDKNGKPKKGYTKELFRDGQIKIINDLKMKGFDYSIENRKLFDLELLADIRHYNGPSCLIDFTSDFLIALWFACETHQDEDGQICILNCYDTERFSVVSSDTKENSIDYFFKDKFKRLWYWIPERLNQRLIEQAAVFIFGEIEIAKKDYISIEVDKDHKKKILKELEKFFDYSKKSLFSDKYAFGDAYKDLDNDENLLEYAIYYNQIGSFKKSKESLIRILDNKDFISEELFLEAKYQLGLEDIRLRKQKLEELEGKKDQIELTKYIKIQLEYLSSNVERRQGQEDLDYKECFNYCLKKDYKKIKIKEVLDRFENRLDEIEHPD